MIVGQFCIKLALERNEYCHAIRERLNLYAVKVSIEAK